MLASTILTYQCIGWKPITNPFPVYSVRKSGGPYFSRTSYPAISQQSVVPIGWITPSEQIHTGKMVSQDSHRTTAFVLSVTNPTPVPNSTPASVNLSYHSSNIFHNFTSSSYTGTQRNISLLSGVSQGFLLLFFTRLRKLVTQIGYLRANRREPPVNGYRTGTCRFQGSFSVIMRRAS